MASPKKTPPPPLPITIFVRPYVLKYVVAKLSDPEKMYWDAGARQLWSDIEAQLAGRQLCGVRDTLDRVSDRPSQRLVLEVRPLPGQRADIGYYLHRYVTATMNKAYLNDMCETVQWYRVFLRQGVRKSLEHFRATYGVSEDDHALHTAERIFRNRSRRGK